MDETSVGVLAAVFALGCSGSSARQLPDAARIPNALFFVENRGNDDRQLDQIIAQTLRDPGLDAIGGPPGRRPEHAMFVVTYEDRWGWDFRTFLRLIQIDVSDRGGHVIATSYSVQDSFAAMGRSYEEIVEETVHRLLDGTL